jgi:hypothetical protein
MFMLHATASLSYGKSLKRGVFLEGGGQSSRVHAPQRDVVIGRDRRVDRGKRFASRSMPPYETEG